MTVEQRPHRLIDGGLLVGVQLGIGTTVAGSAGFISLQIVSGVCKLTTDNATDNAKEQPVAAESSPGFLRWNGPDRTNVL